MMTQPNTPTQPNDSRVTYYVALELVSDIDAGLTTNRAHYWDRSGRLLTHFDEVVTAILTDDLQVAE